MCIEEMLQEEEVRETKWYFTEDEEEEEFQQFMNYTEELMRKALNHAVVSRLNPNAEEFVPVIEQSTPVEFTER